jgi:hypothetical protein
VDSLEPPSLWRSTGNLSIVDEPPSLWRSTGKPLYSGRTTLIMEIYRETSL